MMCRIARYAITTVECCMEYLIMQDFVFVVSFVTSTDNQRL